MKFFEANFATIIIRYNLMIGVIVLAFAVGYPLLGLLGVPIFLSAILGVKFSTRSHAQDEVQTQKNTQVSTLVANRAA